MEAAIGVSVLDWDTAEVVLVRQDSVRAAHDVLRVPGDALRGIQGIRLVVANRQSDWPPPRMIAENINFKEAFARGLAEIGLTGECFKGLRGRTEFYEPECFLISRSDRTLRREIRGRPIFAAKSLALNEVITFATGLCNWLVAHTRHDGRLTYLYKPGTGEEPPRNNAIRQFMATWCLGRAAKELRRPDALKAAQRNLFYNLRMFFKDRGDHGIIWLDGSAKLGAAALAASCILDQQGVEGPEHEILTKLFCGIEKLWQEDGLFRTFHIPADRNDNQNFYPGEALLFLARYADATDGTELRERVIRSILVYRNQHLSRPNPAFVPWHTQACTVLFDATGDNRLAEWVFAMNDWLLTIQQRSAVHADLIGRFYDPDRPEFGPPHASSTAVYLEGLVDAVHIAVAVGDSYRVSQYTTAIELGFANLALLQFRDDTEMFYVRRPDQVRGGMRTNPYDSTIRVDNVQHSLVAAMKWLRRTDPIGLTR